MRRSTIALDRLMTFVVALVMLALGLTGVAWWSGRFSFLPENLNVAHVSNILTDPWWPWALGAAGLVLTLLGPLWLLAHLPARSVTQLNLTGSTKEGRLLADAGPVASAAAASLGATEGVRSARGTIRRDRGQLVARITATVEREADLDAIAAAADKVSAQLRQVLQREDLHCRVDLHTAARNRSLPRVH